VLIGKRFNIIYLLDLYHASYRIHCLLTKEDDTWLWAILKKTPYELFKGSRPVLSQLKVFGYKCFILNNGKEQLGKFDAKVDKGIFLCYATHNDC